MKIRLSELDKKTIVFEVEDDDAGPVVEAFKTRGHGYAIYGEAVDLPIIVIDTRILKEEWCTLDHLIAIEAHELGHILKNTDNEVIAEQEGIKMLQAAGHISAANLLIERGIV